MIAGADPSDAGAGGQRRVSQDEDAVNAPCDAGARCAGLRLPLKRADFHSQAKPMRPSQRAADEMRKVSFERGVARYAEGSCLVRFGDTQVLCAASLEDKPPPWLRGQGRGWVTAEYAMLPRATLTRGRVAWLDGDLRAQAGTGDYVARAPFPAAHAANATWRELTAPQGVQRVDVTP